MGVTATVIDQKTWQRKEHFDFFQELQIHLCMM